MAMQPALAVTVPDNIPVQWYNPQQHHEREEFTMWLRGEFAAANAIIDAMCQHLRGVGGAGEYDDVIGCIQRRRFNWEPVLYMQPYFTIAEVVHALRRVGLRRQDQELHEGGKARGKIGGQKGHFGTEAKAYGGSAIDGGSGVRERFVDERETVDAEEKDEKNESNEDSEVDNSSTRSENTQPDVVQAEFRKDMAVQTKKNLEVTPKSFIAHEIFDGQSVNAAEGMKLYEGLFDDSEISKIISLVSDLRAAGRNGLLQGQTFVVSKRPMNGHGREIIQLGVPIADASPKDEGASGFKDLKTEPMPTLLKKTAEFLHSKQVLSVKPDTCFIDIFEKGDHSQPHMWPQSHGRPVCMLFLTVCDMTFGKVISADHRGDYDGALKLSLVPGSVLVMQGKSTDFSRHAIPSSKNQRMLVMFLKSQPKKTTSTVEPSLRWGPSLIQPTNHIQPKYFATPQISQPNGIIVPVAPIPGIVYPVSAGQPNRPSPPPRHVATQGTGVFFPPGNPSNQTESIDPDNRSKNDDDARPGKSGHEDCNGSTEIITKE